MWPANHDGAMQLAMREEKSQRAQAVQAQQEQLASGQAQLVHGLVKLPDMKWEPQNRGLRRSLRGGGPVIAARTPAHEPGILKALPEGGRAPPVEAIPLPWWTAPPHTSEVSPVSALSTGLQRLASRGGHAEQRG